MKQPRKQLPIPKIRFFVSIVQGPPYLLFIDQTKSPTKINGVCYQAFVIFIKLELGFELIF